MFSSKTTIEKLTTEVLINITSFLNVASILQLSLTSKAFSHLIKDELVFRQLVERDFHVTEKQPDQTWVDLYKQKRSNSLEEQVTQQENSEEEETINLVAEEDTKDSILSQESFTEQVITQEEETTQVEETMQVEETTQEEDTTQEEVVKQEEEITQEEPTASNGIPEQQETTYIEDNSECPHLNQVSDSVNEIKRIIYKSGNQSLCDLCLSQTASYLNMSDNCHYEGKYRYDLVISVYTDMRFIACRQCLESNLVDDEHFPIQFELSTGDMYCFKCNPGHPRKLIDSEKVESIVEYIKAPASSDDLDKRRKAEHQLYVQELRREDMSLKHYLVEKQWGRTWMLFRTRKYIWHRIYKHLF